MLKHVGIYLMSHWVVEWKKMEGVISLQSNTVLFFKCYPWYWPFFLSAFIYYVLLLNTVNGYFFLIEDDNCAIQVMLSDDVTRLICDVIRLLFF